MQRTCTSNIVLKTEKSIDLEPDLLTNFEYHCWRSMLIGGNTITVSSTKRRYPCLVPCVTTTVNEGNSRKTSDLLFKGRKQQVLLPITALKWWKTSGWAMSLWNKIFLGVQHGVKKIQWLRSVNWELRTLLPTGALGRTTTHWGLQMKSEIQECMEDNIQLGMLSPFTLVTVFGNIPVLGSFSHQEHYHVYSIWLSASHNFSP